jgi:hypothetical protein
MRPLHLAGRNVEVDTHLDFIPLVDSLKPFFVPGPFQHAALDKRLHEVVRKHQIPGRFAVRDGIDMPVNSVGSKNLAPPASADSFGCNRIKVLRHLQHLCGFKDSTLKVFFLSKHGLEEGEEQKWIVSDHDDNFFVLVMITIVFVLSCVVVFLFYYGTCKDILQMFFSFACSFSLWFSFCWGLLARYLLLYSLALVDEWL